MFPKTVLINDGVCMLTDVRQSCKLWRHKAKVKLWRSYDQQRVSASDALPSPAPLAAPEGRTVSKAA